MRKATVIFALGLLLFGSQVYAQLYRCTGTNGKTTYSNFPCAHDEKAASVRVTDNAVESRELRNYARAQKEQKYDRDYDGQGGQMAGLPARDMSKAQSYECKLAIKNASNQPTVSKTSARKIDDERVKAAQVCGYNPWSGPSMVEMEADEVRAREQRKERRREEDRRAAAEDSVPSPLTNCDQAGCWDTSGRRYNSTGSQTGNQFFRKDGKFCTRQGTMVQCN